MNWGKCALKVHHDICLSCSSATSFTPTICHDIPKQPIKKQRHHFAAKGLYSQSYGFSSRHVRMGKLDHKEGWVPNNWCFRTVVLEKTLESPLDNKEIKPVNPKGNQPWIYNGRIDAEAEAPILWPPVVKSRLTRKDPDAGKDWGQEEKWATKDERFGWHHLFNEHEFEQALGECEGEWSLACLQFMGSQRTGHKD